MTDDIVSRLRTWESDFDLHWTLPNEAADEIERLRKERDHWMKQSKLLFLQLVQK
jgi:hypothetical protein